MKASTIVFFLRIMPRGSGVFGGSRDGPSHRSDHHQAIDTGNLAQRKSVKEILADSDIIVLDSSPALPKSSKSSAESLYNRQAASNVTQIRARQVPHNMKDELIVLESPEKEESIKSSLESTDHGKAAIDKSSASGGQSGIGATSREGQTVTSSCSLRRSPDTSDSEDEEGLLIDETRTTSSSSSAKRFG